MFDEGTAKKGLLEELMKLASELRAEKLKGKFSPKAEEAPEESVADDEVAEAGVEAPESEEPSPEALEQILALLAEGGDVA